MNLDSEQYSQWLTEQTQSYNIFSALSNNLQKYENIYKNGQNKNTKNNHQIENKKRQTIFKTIDNHNLEINKENLKKNQIIQPQYSVKNKNCFSKFQRNQRITINAEPQRENIHQKQFKIRITSRNSRSSQQQRQDLIPLKLKQFKFQKKDKKKFKDRCVDLYAEIKGKNKISLKEIDNINKQCKQQKIDLFLKLLRR